MVCKKDWEPDHPQKYLRVRETGLSVPFIRQLEDEFLRVCNVITSSAYADLGVADCMQADNTTLSFAFLWEMAYPGVPVPVAPVVEGMAFDGLLVEFDGLGVDLV